jgi:hypothetical protein
LKGVRIVVDEKVEGGAGVMQSKTLSGSELLNIGASFELLCAG